MIDPDALNVVLREMTNRLGGIEAKLESLVGNGQPGRVARLEVQVGELERTRGFVAGAGVALSAVVSGVIALFMGWGRR